MHVCFVSLKVRGALTGHSLNGCIGGAEVQQAVLARGLRRRGWRVSVVVYDAPGPAAGDGSDAGAGGAPGTVDGIDLIGAYRPDAGLPGVRFLHPRWSGLVRALRRADADVYYQRGAGCETGQAARFCRRSGRPFVFAVSSESDCDPALPYLKTWRERVLYRRGLHDADRVVAQTWIQARMLADAFGRECEVIPSAATFELDERHSTALRPSAAPRLLWVGRLSPEKRPEWALELARLRPHWHIDLVGDANVESAYARRVRDEARATPNVTVLGALPRGEMPGRYAAADVLLCTSRWEGFPNTFLEAWAAGVPVVTTVDPDRVVSENGLGAVASSPAELAAAAAELLADRAAYQRTALRCREHLSAVHDPQRVIDRHAALFEELVERGGRRRVMLLISSLEHGGAERQVLELARRMDRTRFEPFICSLSRRNPLYDEARGAAAAGARGPAGPPPLVVVPKRWRFDVTTIPRVARVLRRRRVDLVHAFLFDAEMTARLAAPLARRPVVIASERNADYVRRRSHRLGLRLTRGMFDVLIANSHAGARFVERTQGLPPDLIRVVPNGVDTERFRPVDADALRRSLDVPPGAHVVGMVAAFKPWKRHADFFAVAARLIERFPGAHFVCVGEPLRDNHQGAGDYHRRMRALLDGSGLTPRFRLLGRRDDLPAVYSLCDVTVLPSEHEGTPNVLLESMACGRPVVATDVADNGRIVPAGVGFLVNVGDVDAMTERVAELLASPAARVAIGRAARAWVEREFSVDAMARRTEAVYLDAVAARGRSRGERASTAGDERSPAPARPARTPRDAAVHRGRPASIASRLLLGACYATAIRLSRTLRRLRPTRTGSVERLIAVGTFHNAAWLRAHARPLVESGLRKITFVVDEPLPVPLGVRLVCPPRWARLLLGRALSKLAWMILEASRRARGAGPQPWRGLADGSRAGPTVFMGYHLFPGAWTALVAARLLGGRACYQMTAGPVEIAGGGCENENRLMRDPGRPSRRLERRAAALAREFDHVVVRGEQARAFLREHGVTADVRIIPGSIEAPTGPLDAPRDIDLLYVGRLTAFKRPLAFVDVLAAVQRRMTALSEPAAARPGPRGVIVGEGPQMEDVRRRAEALGVADALELVGRCDDPTPYMARSKTFVLTSRSEGLSIAMAEAMAAGAVPVVARVGELEALVRDGATGYVVATLDDTHAGASDPRREADAFAELIAPLLRDEPRRRAMARAASRAAIDYMSVERVAGLWRQCWNGDGGIEGRHSDRSQESTRLGALAPGLPGPAGPPIAPHDAPAHSATDPQGPRNAAAAFFDAHAERWNGLYERRWTFRDRRRLFVDAVERLVPRGGDVLDAGCGSGNVAIELASRGYRVFAVDGAGEMLAVAERERNRRGVTGLELRRVDLAKFRPRPEVFDAVVCSSVLEYVADDVGLLERLAAALRTGGHLLLSVPHAGSLAGWLEDRLRARGLRSGRAGRAHLRHSLRRYDVRALRQTLARVGLQPLEQRCFELPRLGRVGVALSRWRRLGVMTLLVARKERP